MVEAVFVRQNFREHLGCIIFSILQNVLWAHPSDYPLQTYSRISVEIWEDIILGTGTVNNNFLYLILFKEITKIISELIEYV